MSGAGRYEGRVALVTGGQGFIGSWLVARLLEEGARVVVPRRDVPAQSRFRSEGLERRSDVVQADLTDFEAVVRVLNEHSVTDVFHLAGQTIVGTANRAPLSTFEANVRGTYNLLEACRVVGVVSDPVERVVVASSDKAYGRLDGRAYREDFPLRPTFPYDVSKACADLVAQSYAHSYDLPVAVTRLANVYGGGDLNFSRIVPHTARALALGDRPVLRSDGTPERDFLYVIDAVEAYLAVADSLLRPQLRGRTWNVGPSEPNAVLDVVQRLITISGRDVEPAVDGSGTPRGEIDRQHLDSSAIRAELRWEPRVDLDRGLAETYRWYESALS